MLRGNSAGAQSGTVKLNGLGPDKLIDRGVNHYGRSGWHKLWDPEAQ